MPVSDIVLITVVVASPVVFFSLLFLFAFLYRRHRVPRFLNPPSTRSNHIGGVGAAPCCQACEAHAHRNPGGLKVTVEDGDVARPVMGREFGSGPPPSQQSLTRGSLSQPHFAEKSVSVRRLTHNPYAPDVISRVHSISSTLHTDISGSSGEQEPAKASSEALPFGGGRRGSHASTTQPALLGYQGVEANSIAHGVVAVGDRRPSVLSGGMPDRKESDTLSVRRVSAGGAEDVVCVKPASIDLAQLPVRVVGSGPEQTHGQRGRRPSIKDGELQPPSPPPSGTMPPSHPFNTSPHNRNTRSTSSTPATQPPSDPFPILPGSIAFPTPYVPRMNKPPLGRKTSRPDSLRLTSVRRQMTGDSAIGQGATTGASVMALKSAPLGSASADTLNTVSTSENEESGVGSSQEHINEPEPTPHLFEAWKGFPQRASASAKAVFLQPRHSQPPPPLSHTLPQIIVPAGGEADGEISPTTPRRAAVQPTPTLKVPTPSTAAPVPTPTLSGGLAPPGATTPAPDNKRSSTDSRASKITYLADVVKENEEKRRSAVVVVEKPEEERPKSVHGEVVENRGEGEGVPEVPVRKGSIVSETPPVLSPFPFQGVTIPLEGGDGEPRAL
ncbi:hypothetical protein IAT38_006836 [Cryptococcus sp. DSM 104549]